MRLPFCDHHIYAFLQGLEKSCKPLDLALSDYFRSHKSLGAKDRKLIGETVYGMARWQSLIDSLSPTEHILDRLRCFKKIMATPNFDELPAPKAAKLGIPQFLYSRFLAIFGEEKTIALCKVLNTQAPVTIRANLIKTTRDELYEKLKSKFALSPCKKAPAGLQLEKREPLFALSEFKEGLFEVQDEASQLIAELVQPKPTDHVLDYCSGSGGKTLAFAHKMKGKGQIYLHDIRPQALQEARKRLRRAGVQNVQFTLPQRKVHWVLADVPCSGSGTLRRNPDAKWKIDQALVDRLVEQQREIVKEALQYLAPEGRFVYATCSILPEENQDQVEYFLKTHSLVLEGDPLVLLPEEDGGDGFFAAVFKRSSLL
jgi:16S rRNA (cytosine967-C5)-methyltransferase